MATNFEEIKNTWHTERKAALKKLDQLGYSKSEAAAHLGVTDSKVLFWDCWHGDTGRYPKVRAKSLRRVLEQASRDEITCDYIKLTEAYFSAIKGDQTFALDIADAAWWLRQNGDWRLWIAFDEEAEEETLITVATEELLRVFARNWYLGYVASRRRQPKVKRPNLVTGAVLAGTVGDHLAATVWEVTSIEQLGSVLFAYIGLADGASELPWHEAAMIAVNKDGDLRWSMDGELWSPDFAVVANLYSCTASTFASSVLIAEAVAESLGNVSGASSRAMQGASPDHASGMEKSRLAVAQGAEIA